MFLSHPEWVAASVEVLQINPTIRCLDGTVSGVFDPLISFDSFVHIGSVAPSHSVLPTEWISPCTVDHKPIRPVQCRIRETGNVEIFLPFKSARSFTIEFNCVLIQSVQTENFPIDKSVFCSEMCPGLFKLSGSIIAPVFWDSSFYQLETRLSPNLRPTGDLHFPILSCNNWFVCKIFCDGRILVETATTTIRTTDNPVPLDSVWWSTGPDQVGLEVAMCRIQLQNERAGKMPFLPKKSSVFFALNHIETSTDLLAPGAPGNLVQIEVSKEGEIVANENVMLNSSVFFRVGGDRVILDRADWITTWQTWLTVPDLKAISCSMCDGIEEFAHTLTREVHGRLDIVQLRKLLIDKKVATLKDDFTDPSIHETCAWIRASARPLAPGQLGIVSDYIAKRVILQFTPVLEKVKKFLTSKVPEQEDLMVLSDMLDPLVAADVSAPYCPPPPLGGWMISGKKCAHQIRVAKNALPDELTTLYRIINWFDQWSTMESKLTHSSFLGNQDIFTSSGKWKIPDEPEIQDLLFRNMAWIYKHGYDTFISEIQTPVFPFIEDIDCESTIPMSDTRLIDEIFLGEKFIAERARALKIIYPHITEFKCHIYSSSGFNKSKGRWKSSFHLVWPDIVVDGRLAPIIRQTAVEYFLYKTSTCSFFKRMQYRLMNHFDANIWENVFDQTTSNSMNGLRMPFSNKASWVKTTTGGAAIKYPKVEDRHCFPRGTVVITIDGSRSDPVSLEVAMKRLVDAEETLTPMRDQNAIVHDRTQYKSIDKNTINRTSAFFKAMKAVGGDTVGDLSVTTKWVEEIKDPKLLTDEEIFLWIKRGSCRRGGLTTSDLTRFNKVFVDEFETADLDIFDGHTLESLRKTDIWAKMTPAAQAGIKTRFRKYLLKKSMKTVGTLKEEKREEILEEEEEVEGDTTDEELSPPVNDEIELFDEIGTDLEYIWKYKGTVNEFERQLRSALKMTNSEGYWIHTQMSVSWISERETRSNGWGSFLDVYSNDQTSGKQSVSVSFYHHCGKVVISGHKSSKIYMFILKAIKSFCETDDGLYHKLVLPQMSEESFPLLDEDELIEQREQYKQRWLCMKSVV